MRRARARRKCHRAGTRRQDARIAAANGGRRGRLPIADRLKRTKRGAIATPGDEIGPGAQVTPEMDENQRSAACPNTSAPSPSL